MTGDSTAPACAAICSMRLACAPARRSRVCRRGCSCHSCRAWFSPVVLPKVPYHNLPTVRHRRREAVTLVDWVLDRVFIVILLAGLLLRVLCNVLNGNYSPRSRLKQLLIVVAVTLKKHSAGELGRELGFYRTIETASKEMERILKEKNDY